MHRALPLSGLAAVALISLHAIGTADAQSAPSGRVGWKGTTAAKVLTDAGQPALNAACTAEFPGTRVCLASEVLGSVPAPAPGATGFVISDMSSALPWGNMAVVMSDLGLGFVTNCAETGGMFKTKKDGSVMLLEGDGNLRTTTCKDVYAEGGAGVACCGF